MCVRLATASVITGADLVHWIRAERHGVLLVEILHRKAAQGPLGSKRLVGQVCHIPCHIQHLRACLTAVALPEHQELSRLVDVPKATERQDAKHQRDNRQHPRPASRFYCTP